MLAHYLYAWLIFRGVMALAVVLWDGIEAMHLPLLAVRLVNIAFAIMAAFCWSA